MKEDLLLQEVEKNLRITKERIENTIKSVVDTHNELVSIVERIRENDITLSRIDCELSSCIVEIRTSLIECGFNIFG